MYKEEYPDDNKGTTVEYLQIIDNFVRIMKRNLIITFILCCISLMTMHSADHTQESDQISATIATPSEFTITEYTHEHSASRPTNITVPSIVRTSAGRSNPNTGGNFNFSSQEARTQSIIALSGCLRSNLLSCGYSDSGSLFISLGKLII